MMTEYQVSPHKQQQLNSTYQLTYSMQHGPS
jgi:hypothetical protein